MTAAPRAARAGLSLMAWLLLLLLPPLALLVSLGSGTQLLTPMAVVTALLEPAFPALQSDDTTDVLVRLIRLPRTLLVAVCGAGLAVSGAALQGALRNPLVSPQTIGVLSGAGFGGALGLLLAFGKAGVIGLAFVSGIAAMLLVLLVGNSRQHSSVLMLILSGMVISTLFAAGTTLLQYHADAERELPALVYWLMGSFSIATLDDLAWAVPPIVVACGILMARSHWLNLLASGDDEAHALGANVERERLVILLCVAACCAAVVSVGGLVAWVGLLIPHITRMVVGTDHRRLLPAAASLGFSYLLLVDVLSRTLGTTEIPLSALTALIGAPIFIHLLRNTHGFGWLAH